MRGHRYHRISEDSARKGLGIERQDGATSAVLALLGVTELTEPYVDNDKSASNGDVRPAYERLLADIRSGVIARGDVIAGYNQDRIVRDMIELEQLIKLCRRHGVQLHTQSGPINIKTADGRTMTRIMGALAKGETEKLGERVTSKMAANAAAGMPHGRVGFGWRRVVEVEPRTGRRLSWHDEVDPGAKAIVVDIAQRVINGDSINAIARGLNAAKVPPPELRTRCPLCRKTVRVTAQELHAQEKHRRSAADVDWPADVEQWTAQMVRGLVLRPSNAGKRVYQAQSDEPTVFDGAWEPLLDEATYTQVSAILRDPKRRTSPGGQPRHLLSLIARCGHCEEASPMTARLNGRMSYRCSARACTMRRIDKMDEYVTEFVLGWFTTDEARSLLAATSDGGNQAALARVAELEAELSGAVADRLAGLITRAQMLQLNSVWKPELERAEAEASRVLSGPVWADLVGEDPAPVWEGFSLPRKRSVLAELFDVTVHKSKRGRGVWDPDSIVISLRDGDGEALAA